MFMVAVRINTDIHEMKLVWIRLIKLLKSIHANKFLRCVHEINADGYPDLVIFCDGSPLEM